jgi:hypothetical protein
MTRIVRLNPRLGSGMAIQGYGVNVVPRHAATGDDEEMEKNIRALFAKNAKRPMTSRPGFARKAQAGAASLKRLI